VRVAEDGFVRGEGLAGPPLPLPPGARRRTNWVGWALAGFVLVSCFLFVNVHDLARELRRLDPAEILVLVLISSADRLLMGYKWALLLRIVGVDLPMPRVIRYFYQGSFTGLFLPSHIGGDILRAWWVSRDSGVRHPVYASLVVERLLGFASAISWAIAGAAVFLSYLRPQHTVLWLLAGVLGLVLANGAFAALVFPGVHAFVLRRLEGRRSRLVRIMHDFYAAFASFAAEPRQLALNWLLCLVEQGLQMFLYFGIAVSIDAQVTLVPFLAATAVFTLVLRLPIAPDGWGVGELSAIGIYGLVGLVAAQAFTVSAIGHIIPMLALAPGFLLLLGRGRDGTAGAGWRG
jgi:glycosyltransferase 2 family protein